MKLVAHLLQRLPGDDTIPDGYESSLLDIGFIRIQDDCPYKHKVMRVNYTTCEM